MRRLLCLYSASVCGCMCRQLSAFRPQACAKDIQGRSCRRGADLLQVCMLSRILGHVRIRVDFRLGNRQGDAQVGRFDNFGIGCFERPQMPSSLAGDRFLVPKEVKEYLPFAHKLFSAFFQHTVNLRSASEATCIEALGVRWLMNVFRYPRDSDKAAPPK